MNVLLLRAVPKLFLLARLVACLPAYDKEHVVYVAKMKRKKIGNIYNIEEENGENVYSNITYKMDFKSTGMGF